MPELPDIVVYQECMQRHIAAAKLLEVRINDPFLLRTAEIPASAAEGRRVAAVERIGKRIVIEFEDELFLVFHLMIAGRLHWQARSARGKGRGTLASFAFETGRLTLSEAGSRRRASLHIVQGIPALEALNPGGLEILQADADAFIARLRADNHTLKRALTDPHLFSGIGNAYSDEILHRARLSPFTLTGQIPDDDAKRLFQAARSTLSEWADRLRSEANDGWPKKVTAFHGAMAVHGRFGHPCPDCGSPVQRIVYAQNETNYCARCQTGGKVLADRALSRLLKASWPRSIDELG